MIVKKRNGKLVHFDKEKILLAIAKAYDGEYMPKYATKIVKKIERDAAKQHKQCVSVEEI